MPPLIAHFALEGETLSSRRKSATNWRSSAFVADSSGTRRSRNPHSMGRKPFQNGVCLMSNCAPYRGSACNLRHERLEANRAVPVRVDPFRMRSGGMEPASIHSDPATHGTLGSFSLLSHFNKHRFYTGAYPRGRSDLSPASTATTACRVPTSPAPPRPPARPAQQAMAPDHGNTAIRVPDNVPATAPHHLLESTPKSYPDHSYDLDRRKPRKPAAATSIDAYVCSQQDCQIGDSARLEKRHEPAEVLNSEKQLCEIPPAVPHPSQSCLPRTAMRWCRVRKNSVPRQMAGVARQASPSEFRARSLKLVPVAMT